MGDDLGLLVVTNINRCIGNDGIGPCGQSQSRAWWWGSEHWGERRVENVTGLCGTWEYLENSQTKLLNLGDFWYKSFNYRFNFNRI